MKHKQLFLRLVAFFCLIVPIIFCLAYCYKLQRANSIESPSTHSESISNHFLPNDLLYNGSPIHPSYVFSTQWGDSSSMDPKLIDQDFFFQEPEYVSDYTILFDPETKKCTASWKYEDYYLYDQSYTYIGSYKNKHVVLAENYTGGKIGRITMLGLITRDGNTICNAGEITGTYGWNSIRVLSLEENLLRFEETVSPDCVPEILSCSCMTDLEKESILQNLSKQIVSDSDSDFYSYCDSYVDYCLVTYEVNLDTMKQTLCDISLKLCDVGQKDILS